MEITHITEKNMKIASISNDKVLITDVQSALDFIATVQYETGINRIILNKSALCEGFFSLKTKLAGEILQKFVNYGVKIAIVGDFSLYTSKSLKDFIYESNKGRYMFFVSNEKDAVERLCID